MPVLNREALKGLTDKKLKVVRVTLREWAVDAAEPLWAYIGQMTADERDERLEALWLKRREKFGRDDNVGFRAFAVAACLCNEDRQWVADNEAAINELADQFGDMSAVPVTRMFDHACNLNGLTAADVEELEAKLSADPFDAGSGSEHGTPTAPAPANTSND